MNFTKVLDKYALTSTVHIQNKIYGGFKGGILHCPHRRKIFENRELKQLLNRMKKKYSFMRVSRNFEENR